MFVVLLFSWFKLLLFLVQETLITVLLLLRWCFQIFQIYSNISNITHICLCVTNTKWIPKHATKGMARDVVCWHSPVCSSCISPQSHLGNVLVDMKLIDIKDTLPVGFIPIQETVDTRKSTYLLLFIYKHSPAISAKSQHYLMHLQKHIFQNIFT